jgi:hypothetical protein
MLVLALLNTSEGDKRVRVHGVPGATFRWHLGEIGDSHPGPVLDARYGEDWITVPNRGKATITLKLAELRGTARAREGDRVRFAIEDAAGRLDCEFRLERIAYDYLLVSLVAD